MSSRIATHPGTILSEEFMAPLAISARSLAANLQVSRSRIQALAKGRASVTADTAIRLGRHFRTSSEFWINLQTAHDLSKAEAEHSYASIMPRQYAAQD